jgi:hypothetical protein
MRNKFENLGVIRHGPTSSGHPWFFLDVDIKGWTPAQRPRMRSRSSNGCERA